MAITQSKLKTWGYHVLIAIDQLFNALIGGAADETAAAFGRLCVETAKARPLESDSLWQPPSGGCVLKPRRRRCHRRQRMQPPSGGCVLKPHKTATVAGRCSCSRLRAAVC